MQYWLMKSEPSTYSIDMLMSKPHKTDYWDGIRNYQVRNFLRDQMQIGDLAFFYHSSCAVPGIVGIMEIIEPATPDLLAFNPGSDYFDPKSTPQKPQWFRVKVKGLKKFKDIIPLTTLKSIPKLHNMPLLRPGNRLSVTPVQATEWETILKLVHKN